MEQRRLGLADIGGQVLEARRLAGLALQAFDLAFELADHVVEAFEVLLGGAAAEARPRGGACRPEMPAASSSRARRACGLAWISSPMRPCPTIEGERAPVDWSANSSCTSLARASLAVDAIDRAGLALDAARHLQFDRHR